MKKSILLLSLLSLLSVSLYAQTLQYETEIRYNTDASDITADITVTVTQGSPVYTFYLMTNDLLKGEVLMQSEPTGDKQYTFRQVKAGKYILKITDGTGVQTGRTIVVKETEN
jgi:hypothetical protein